MLKNLYSILQSKRSFYQSGVTDNEVIKNHIRNKNGARVKKIL